MRGKLFEKSVEESSVEEIHQLENMKMLEGLQNCCKCSAAERKSTCPNFIRLELLREKAAIIQFVLTQNHMNSGINSVLLKELDIDEFMPMPLANYECCKQILAIAKLEMKMKAYETMLRKEKFGLADKFINDFNVDEEVKIEEPKCCN